MASIICVSKLSSASHERQALRVFVRSRSFADEYKFRFRIAIAKHKLVSSLVQLASRAIAQILSNFQKRVILHFLDRFE